MPSDELDGDKRDATPGDLFDANSTFPGEERDHNSTDLDATFDTDEATNLALDSETSARTLTSPLAIDDDDDLRNSLEQPLGNYVLIRQIGQGGMGSVYLARHKQFRQRRYAIKVISGALPTPMAKSRFEREIAAMGSLDHPNLIFATDAEIESDPMYLVMEYVPGHDLQQSLGRHGRLTFGVAAEILRQTALALDFAHGQQIIHRDVKPSNLIVTPDGVVKLLDLGIASLQSGPQRLTAQGDMLGTAPFMAPEIWTHGDQVVPASDLYSLGCTAYCLLLGHPPFTGQTMASLCESHLHQAPPRLEDAVPDIPIEMVRLIEDVMIKEPEDRLASAAAFAERIAPYCEPITDPSAFSQSNGKRASSAVVDTDTEPPETDRVIPSGIRESISVDDHWTRNRTRQKPIVKKIIIVASTMILISILSITLSYFPPMTSPAWLLRFDRVGDPSTMPGFGFIVELVRGAVYIASVVTVLSLTFTREIRLFFNWRVWKRSIVLLRLAVILIAGVFVGMEASRQLDPSQAATGMVDWAALNGIDTTPEIEARPYLPYFVYSSVNYVVIVGGLIAFPFARFFFSDLSYIVRQLATFRSQQDRTLTGEKLTRNLYRFGSELRNLTSRYVLVLATLSVAAHYEYWIGAQTLTEEGLMTLLFGFIGTALTAVFLITITVIYFQGFDKTSRRITMIGNVADEQTLSKIDAIWFVKTIFVYRLSGLFCLSALIVLLHSWIAG